MVVCTVLSLALPSAGAAQDASVRFEITGVGDSTFTLAIGRDTWVRRGQHGIAVDPTHRDALVARFTVIRVDARNGQATALVTGQTTRIGTNHVALLMRPSSPWYRKPVFWIGTAVGAVLGVVLASHPF